MDVQFLVSSWRLRRATAGTLRSERPVQTLAPVAGTEPQMEELQHSLQGKDQSDGKIGTGAGFVVFPLASLPHCFLGVVLTGRAARG